jgi:hypothetical protein
MFQNFTPLFELAVALNIAYTSIPQLGNAISLSVSRKLNIQIEKLKEKTADARVKLTTIDEAIVGKNRKEELNRQLNTEENQTNNILKNVNDTVKVANKNISDRMCVYFLVTGRLSGIYLYLIGTVVSEEGSPIVFPTESLFYIYLFFIAFIFIFKMSGFISGDFYKKGFLGLIFLFIISISIWYGSNLCNYLSSLNYSDMTLINIMLFTTFIPLLATIPQYIYSSYKISKLYSDRITKQELDMGELIPSILDASTSPKSVTILNNVENAKPQS